MQTNIMITILSMTMYTPKHLYQSNKKQFTFRSVSPDRFRIIKTMEIMTSNNGNCKLKLMIQWKQNTFKSF